MEEKRTICFIVDGAVRRHSETDFKVHTMAQAIQICSLLYPGSTHEAILTNENGDILATIKMEVR